MNDIHLIFIDIDGTLITDDKLIPPNTRKVLQKIVADKKIQLILISARMPKSLELICNELKIPMNYVAFNGSLSSLDFINSSKFKINEKKVLQQSLVKSAMDCVTDWKNTSFNIYTKDKWITNNRGYWTKREIKSTYVNPDVDNLTIDNVDNEIKDKFVYKILIRSNPKKLKIVVENLKNKKINKKALLIVSKPTLVEITPFGINKGLSIDEISKITNIDTKNMMAFGDAENDIEMIKKVKYGYAMGNSNDELKKIAYKVIQSNNEEGVAKELIKKLNL